MSLICLKNTVICEIQHTTDFQTSPHQNIFRSPLSPPPTEIFNIVLYKRREENQLDATECFIAIIIRSTCFWHSYAHRQELETILMLLPRMVCNALVAGGRLLGAEQQAMRLG